MKDQRKRVAKRLASGLLAGALALGGLAISSGSVTAKTPSSLTTQRLSGADRYETAVAVARDLIAGGAGNPTGLVIASGASPYDALAGSVLTTANRPLLLVQKDSIPTSVSNFLSDYRTSFRDAAASVVYVLGGESAISAATLTAITSAVTTSGDLTPPTVIRISGADRYATAKAVSDVAGVTVASDRLIIVNGENDKWADALSAGLLAAENGWPIVLTTSTGLQASAKAKIDSYLALGGSAELFTIVGGTSVVPTAVTDYLVVDNGVPPANITRYAGADRYATNKAVNDAAYAAGVRGVNVALVSGVSPWDALAASAWAAFRNASLLMTPTAGGNIGVSTFAVVASVYSYLGFGGNSNLWVIGGTSAVADSAKLGYIGAASSVNLTSTLTCDDTHSVANFGTAANTPTAILTLSGAVGTAENGAISTATAGQVKEGTANITHTVTDFNALGLSNTAGTTFLVSLPASTTVGSTISWAGWTESVAVGAYTPTRSIAGSSCVYSADVTAPSVTLTAVEGNNDVPGTTTTTTSALRLILSSNEPITVSGTAPFVSIGALSVTTAATVSDISQGGQTKFLINLPTTGALPPAAVLTAASGNAITLQAASIRDAAGNNPAASPVATIGTDSTGPTFGTPSVSVSAVSNATIVSGGLNFTALPASLSGTKFGARGNSWQLAVVNQRGLVLPTVALNATTKTITVTVDAGYHTPSDVKNAYAETGDGDWSVGAGALANIAPTVANANVNSAGGVAGVSNVRVSVSTNEPVTYNTGGLSVTVSDLISGAVTSVAQELTTAYAATNVVSSYRTRVRWTFSTTSIGTATLNFLGNANGVYDSHGNRSTGAVTFTIS